MREQELEMNKRQNLGLPKPLLDLQSSQNEMSDEEAAETGATSNSHVKFVLKGCS